MMAQDVTDNQFSVGPFSPCQTTRRASATVMASGFSTKTWAPASMARQE